MLLNLQDLNPSERYHLMTQSIIARPIAWILTQSQNASFNLAPYSYFNVLASDPVMVVFSGTPKAADAITDNPTPKAYDPSLKDTVNNIDACPFFTLHIPNVAQLEAVKHSANPLPYGQSELEGFAGELVDWLTINTADFPIPKTGGFSENKPHEKLFAPVRNNKITSVDTASYTFKRLIDTPIAMACRLLRHEWFGDAPQSLLYAEVLQVYVDDKVIYHDNKGRLNIDPKTVDPLLRVGAGQFATLGEVKK